MYSKSCYMYGTFAECSAPRQRHVKGEGLLAANKPQSTTCGVKPPAAKELQSWLLFTVSLATSACRERLLLGWYSEHIFQTKLL
jgi:hypothetical protein